METVKVAHISDLHFDPADLVRPAWKALSRHLSEVVQPHLLLITGDLVDSPEERSYQQAKTALQELCDDVGPDRLKIPFFVCPGNHDRHWRGNVVSKKGWFQKPKPVASPPSGSAASFDYAFQGRIPGITEARKFDISLGPEDNRWNLRILGLDSSIEADFFARGCVATNDINQIKNAMATAAEIDLGILLVHHHVFPVRANEDARQHNKRDLANVISLVNAGNFVEALARAHVDMVLHGHEHAANWGRYATFEHGGGETNILGAGSATGAVTGSGFDRRSASFNLIELRGDRSVEVSVHRFDGAHWSAGSRFDIYDSQALRRARFLRRGHNRIQRLPESDVVRYIECSREGDWIIRETRTKVEFSSKPRIALTTKNTTGKPTDLKVELVESGWTPEGDLAFVSTNRENTYCFECDVPKSVSAQIQTLRFSFRWLGGAIRTSPELEVIDPARRGPHRKEGFEFGAIRVDGYFRELRLVIRLPPEFSPEREGLDRNVIQAFIEGPNHAREPLATPQADIGDRLRIVGPGLYTLVIPYPREGFSYGIKWKPPPAPTADRAEAKFAKAARQEGNHLAAAFHEGLAKTVFFGKCRLTLYIGEGQTRLIAVGHYPATDGMGSPPISLARQEDVVISAWRGLEVVAVRREEGASPDLGYGNDEIALIALPVRFGLSWTNDPPWGVLRIGVLGKSQDVRNFLENPGNGALLSEQLLPPMIRLLSEANL